MTEKSRVESFYFPVVPVAKGRPRFTNRGFAYTPKKTREAEQELRDLAILTKCKPFENALSIFISFYIPRPKSVKRKYPTVKPDLDNFCKAVDAFNGILWKDDAQIIEMTAVKQYADEEHPFGIVLTIMEVPE